MEDLDYVYDKFENLIIFLQDEVNNIEECIEFVEAKKSLNDLFKFIENGV